MTVAMAVAAVVYVTEERLFMYQAFGVRIPVPLLG